MAGWYAKRQGWARRLGAGLSAAGPVAGLTVVMPPGQVSVAAARHPAPALPKVKAAAGVGVLHRVWAQRAAAYTDSREVA
jgi:hypothetical protein